MADFCRECAGMCFGENLKDQNDLTHTQDKPIPALCEGCGYHLFNQDGSRIHKMPEDFYTDKDYDLSNLDLSMDDDCLEKWGEWLGS